MEVSDAAFCAIRSSARGNEGWGCLHCECDYCTIMSCQVRPSRLYLYYLLEENKDTSFKRSWVLHFNSSLLMFLSVLQPDYYS